MAAGLLLVIGFKQLFLISIIPAVLAAGAILLLTKEAVKRTGVAHIRLSLRELATTRGPFRRLLTGTGLYGLGNFSATLLILRATDLLTGDGRPIDRAASIAVLLYAVHNMANAVVAYPAGALADRIGRRQVLVTGIALFSLSCLGFAFTGPNIIALALLFALVGASTALVETGRGSHAAELLDDSHRGRGFGLLGLVDGVGDLVSSVAVGVLWTITAPGWGFAFAAAMAAVGAMVLALPASRSRT